MSLAAKREIRVAWESQVDVLDLRAEPEEFIAVGADKVVVPIRMVACGRGSEMALAASIVWLWTLGDDGSGTRVEVFETAQRDRGGERDPRLSGRPRSVG